MLQEVQKKIKEFYMIESGETVLVGVSGGADSVCLLLMLTALCREMHFFVEAVHVEHGIRGQESREDAAYVEKLCEKIQVPCHIFFEDVPNYAKEKGVGIEEAARILRYEAFRKLAQKKQAEKMSVKVALAHHIEDNAETILFQLLRGSSLTGLCGMQPMRTDAEGVTYIRPLLFLHRSEIEQFLAEQKVEYRMDSTNLQVEYTRNYIRNEIFPKLRQVNPQAAEHIHATAMQLNDIREFLETETQKAWEQVAEEQEKPFVLRADVLRECPIAIQKEIVYRAITQMLGARKDVSTVHVEQVLKLCDAQSGKEVHLPNQLLAKKEYEKIQFIYNKKKQVISDGEGGVEIFVSEEELDQIAQSGEERLLPLGETRDILRIKIFPYDAKSFEIPQKTYTKCFNYDIIKRGFCIRTRRSGDAFISDVCGHRKKLKQYFIDEKIPATMRETLWLLAQEHTVLWLVGGRISEHVKVTEHTKTIIEITYDGGQNELRKRF